MKKVLVIAGPTAAGKSDFAVEMAKQLDGIIISGDSIQVYRGFDIGSGKITKAEMQGIPHELIDILGPRDHYSAADFQKMARAIIDTTEKFPMICGGTGLYLKACLYDYAFPAENHEDTIDPALDKLDNDALYALLVEKDRLQMEEENLRSRQEVLATARTNNEFIDRFLKFQRERENLISGEQEIRDITERLGRQKTATHEVYPVYAAWKAKADTVSSTETEIKNKEESLRTAKETAKTAAEQFGQAEEKRERAKELQKEIDKIGFFVIVTSKEMTASEALDIYRKRDSVEKIFRTKTGTELAREMFLV